MVTSGAALRGRRWLEQEALGGGQMDAFSGFGNCITMGCVLGLCRGGFSLFMWSLPTLSGGGKKRKESSVMIIFELL